MADVRPISPAPFGEDRPGAQARLRRADREQNVHVSPTESWPARTFSLANAEEDRPGDLPHLLRRLADRIEALGVDSMNILDLTVSSEITGEGPWWSATSIGRLRPEVIKELRAVSDGAFRVRAIRPSMLSVVIARAAR